jgi:hypothetical protein
MAKNSRKNSTQDAPAASAPGANVAIHSPSPDTPATPPVEIQPEVTQPAASQDIAPETAFSVIKSALPLISSRVGLLQLLTRLQSFKPAKPVFSTNKAERKGQMVSYKIADRAFRAALGLVYRHAEDKGWGDHSDRHSASVTKSGIVSLRRSETLKISPDAGSRFTL